MPNAAGERQGKDCDAAGNSKAGSVPASLGLLWSVGLSLRGAGQCMASLSCPPEKTPGCFADLLLMCVDSPGLLRRVGHMCAGTCTQVYNVPTLGFGPDSLLLAAFPSLGSLTGSCKLLVVFFSFLPAMHRWSWLLPATLA